MQARSRRLPPCAAVAARPPALQASTLVLVRLTPATPSRSCLLPPIRTKFYTEVPQPQGCRHGGQRGPSAAWPVVSCRAYHQRPFPAFRRGRHTASLVLPTRSSSSSGTITLRHLKQSRMLKAPFLVLVSCIAVRAEPRRLLFASLPHANPPTRDETVAPASFWPTPIEDLGPCEGGL